VISIPYELIANIIASAYILYGFVIAEIRGRIVILILAAATFLGPKILPSLAMRIACFAARVLLAIGCALYGKWRNASP
jgi:hypothetical protein